MHRSLGVGFWLVNVLLEFARQEKEAVSNVWVGYKIVLMLLDNWHIHDLDPSPLKEAILRLVAKTLSTVHREENVIVYSFFWFLEGFRSDAKLITFPIFFYLVFVSNCLKYFLSLKIHFSFCSFKPLGIENTGGLRFSQDQYSSYWPNF